jgi:hypothetical protein
VPRKEDALVVKAPVKILRLYGCLAEKLLIESASYESCRATIADFDSPGGIEDCISCSMSHTVRRPKSFRALTRARVAKKAADRDIAKINTGGNQINLEYRIL